MSDVNNKNIKVVIVRGEDWQGIYVNGILKDEGHSLDIEDVSVAILGEENVETINLDSEDSWEELGCSLPELIYKVKEVHKKYEGNL